MSNSATTASVVAGLNPLGALHLVLAKLAEMLCGVTIGVSAKIGRRLIIEHSGAIVVQSTITSSLPDARGSRSWTSRATNSLPVPLSPIRSTAALVKRATSTTCRSIDRQAGLLPTRFC